MEELHAGTASISICLIVETVWGSGTLLCQQSHLLLSQCKCTGVINVLRCVDTDGAENTVSSCGTYRSYVFYKQVRGKDVLSLQL